MFRPSGRALRDLVGRRHRVCVLREGVLAMIALQTFLRTAESLGDLSRARADALRHMIADLMETGNFRNRGDAVRQLHGDGYPTIDIMILVGEAIYACQQEVIAR